MVKKGFTTKKKGAITSPIKQKVILLLLGGLALGLSRSPRRQGYIFREIKREWKQIDPAYLHRIVREFHQERLVSFEEKPDGTIKIVLTEAGKEKAIQCDFDRMEIKKPIRWDKKWRIVIFDIPEKRRKTRDALRHKLAQLGFLEYQHSVFVYPFSCRNEIDFIVEFFRVREYVRYGEVINFTNEAELKLRFGLV
jgi:hypothetical protein